MSGDARGRDGMSIVPEGYCEHAPPPDLARYVACFWTGLVSASMVDPRPADQRVLPDGCVDIVIGFGRAGDSSAGGGGDVTEAIGVGSMTRPLLITGERARLYVGVRFNPGFAFAAFGIPAAELTDESADYRDLFGEANGELDALSDLSTSEERLEAMVGLVRRRLIDATAVPTSVRAAVRRVCAARGNVRVAGLAAEIGLTRQQLARLFATHVGVTPKTFARVMRTQTALARADAARAAYPRGVDWSAIAYELGYYDQAHFIDEFKQMTGLTPSKWFG